MQHRFRVVAVNVENRRIDHFTQRQYSNGVLRLSCGQGGEADLVIGNDVHGTANTVAFQLTHLEAFGDDALTSHSCVTMDQNWDDRLRSSVSLNWRCLARTRPAPQG